MNRSLPHNCGKHKVYTRQESKPAALYTGQTRFCLRRAASSHPAGQSIHHRLIIAFITRNQDFLNIALFKQEYSTIPSS